MNYPVISQSKSDNCMNKYAKLNLNPLTMTTKDFVLNPLAKFAKNVQSFATTLDVSSASRRRRNSQELDQCRKMLQNWSNCQSEFIIL